MQGFVHFSHPGHPLQHADSGTAMFFCSGCNLQWRGRHFRCSACNFNLHRACVKFRTTFASPHVHGGHTLTLAYEQQKYSSSANAAGRFCDICRGFITSGLYYECRKCDFDAHLMCVVNILRNKESRPPPPQQAGGRGGRGVGSKVVNGLKTASTVFAVAKLVNFASEMTLGVGFSDFLDFDNGDGASSGSTYDADWGEELAAGEGLGFVDDFLDFDEVHDFFDGYVPPYHNA